jgi:alpha-glucosidase
VTAINQPELHPLYRRWRSLANEYPGERMFVGEIVLADQDRIARFLEADQLQLAFNFSLLHETWNAGSMRATIDRTRAALDAVGADATWVFENHDVTRLPTRYGGGDEGLRRARAAALLLLALPGTAFLYEGQELGLEEVDLPDEARRDPILVRSKGARKGRDGCRVPIPWDSTQPAFGFTTGTPWLPMPETWAAKSVAAQRADPDSTLEFWRAALALRPALRGASFEWRESEPGALVFARHDVVCLVNVEGAALELPHGEVLITSGALAEGRLPRDTAAWVRTRSA